MMYAMMCGMMPAMGHEELVVLGLYSFGQRPYISANCYNCCAMRVSRVRDGRYTCFYDATKHKADPNPNQSLGSAAARALLSNVEPEETAEYMF